MTERPETIRVVLLTHPGLYGAIVTARLRSTKGISLVGVGLSARVFKGKSHLSAAIHFIRKTGLTYSLYKLLVAKVSWLILNLCGSIRKIFRDSDVKRLVDCNSAESLDWIKGMSPDYIVSSYFGQKISLQLASIAARRCINVHPSLLPKHRGPDPVFRALESKDRETGVSIHIVDDDFDTGPLLVQEKCSIPEGISVFSLASLLCSRGADLCSSFLTTDNHTPGIQQSDRGSITKSWPTPSEVNRFCMHGRLIGMSEYLKTISSTVLQINNQFGTSHEHYQEET